MSAAPPRPRAGVAPLPVLLDGLRRVRDAVWRPAATGLAVGVVGYGLGMTRPSALTAAAVAVTLAAVLLRVDAVAEPRRERPTVHVRDGVRGEVQDLAWAMAGRDGRTGERAMRQLRAAATRRLARHGVDLQDPAQADAVAALVGARALATLTRRQHPLPSVADLVHTIEALERLGPTRTRPAPPARPPGPAAAAPAAPAPGTPHRTAPDPRSVR